MTQVQSLSQEDPLEKEMATHSSTIESHRRNGLAIMVKKGVQNAVLGCSLKNDRMISVHFQANHSKYHSDPSLCPSSDTEEAEVERFYEDLQDLLKLTPPKDILFIIGDWNAKVGSQERSNRQIWPWNAE